MVPKNFKSHSEQPKGSSLVWVLSCFFNQSTWYWKLGSHMGAAEGLLLNMEAAEIIHYHFFRCCFNDSKFIWAIVGKWKHFFYFVHFPHISAMTKYFTSTQLLIFSTSGKIFQPQLFWHQNISTCPSFFCYDEIIFQITNFWIKRLLIQPKLFQHTTWIGLLCPNISWLIFNFRGYYN